MKDREPILSKLNNYRGSDEDEEKSRHEIIDFINNNPECFDRAYKPGHITGSALVVDKYIEFTLLTHHTKLDRWFQLGGHSDGDNDPLNVAFREAGEESGLKSLAYLPGFEGIFDVDVHPIPEKGDMPTHNHFDIRVLLAADKNEPFVVSGESKELKWVSLGEVRNYNQQPAFLRLINKAILLSK
jgi:8-oxo-dGTP pyrophosphatase MutT (NUDIX family)